MDYVYVTYKVDKYFHINERELQLLMNYYNLERTYQKEKSLSVDDDIRLELDLCYDLKQLSRLVEVLG